MIPSGSGWCGPIWGNPPTWEKRPSETADKEMEEQGLPRKEGGSAPCDVAKREARERRDDKLLLNKTLQELSVEETNSRRTTGATWAAEWANAKSSLPFGRIPGETLEKGQILTLGWATWKAAMSGQAWTTSGRS